MAFFLGPTLATAFPYFKRLAWHSIGVLGYHLYNKLLLFQNTNGNDLFCLYELLSLQKLLCNERCDK